MRNGPGKVFSPKNYVNTWPEAGKSLKVFMKSAKLPRNWAVEGPRVERLRERTSIKQGFAEGGESCGTWKLVFKFPPQKKGTEKSCFCFVFLNNPLYGKEDAAVRMDSWSDHRSGHDGLCKSTWRLLTLWPMKPLSKISITHNDRTQISIQHGEWTSHLFYFCLRSLTRMWRH